MLDFSAGTKYPAKTPYDGASLLIELNYYDPVYADWRASVKFFGGVYTALSEVLYLGAMLLIGKSGIG